MSWIYINIIIKIINTKNKINILNNLKIELIQFDNIHFTNYSKDLYLLKNNRMLLGLIKSDKKYYLVFFNKSQKNSIIKYIELVYIHD